MALNNSSWALHSCSSRLPLQVGSPSRSLFRSSGQIHLRRRSKEGSFFVSGFPASKRNGASLVSPVRCSLDVIAPNVGTVTEVNKDTFWPLVKGAGDKVVVLDMFTQW